MRSNNDDFAYLMFHQVFAFYTDFDTGCQRSGQIPILPSSCYSEKDQKHEGI
jgi:hypothetical protein